MPQNATINLKNLTKKYTYFKASHVFHLIQVSNTRLTRADRSALCFDYPVIEEGTESAKNRELAAAAGEEMKAKYSCEEMEAILSESGFLIYERLDKEAAGKQLFRKYNEACPEDKMNAPKGVEYCLAVKK